VLIDITLSLLEKGRCRTSSKVSFDELVRALAVTNRFRAEMASYGPQTELQIPVSQTPIFEECLRQFRSGQGGDGKVVEPFSRGSTTHVSVLDKDGNGASVTTTNGEGCGYVLPELGFMLNNMLGEEDLNPKGFFKYPAGSRLASMMAPTIVRRDKEPVLLTGTAGSNRIRSVIVQLLVNHLYRGMDIEEATKAPRVHLEGRTLHVEPDIDEDELSLLPDAYYVERWQRQNLFFGGANSVTPHAGAADARRGGVALAFG
jgi:gamma-glutamyltranspeptidase/glutathione hydrolase